MLQTAVSTKTLSRKERLRLLELEEMELTLERERRRRENENIEQKAGIITLEERHKAFIAAYPFKDFVTEAFKVVEPGRKFRDNWHIDIIAELLQAVILGDVRNFIINQPRRTMKSLLTCVFFPCWVWTFLPHLRFLFTSYSKDFAKRDNKKCQDLINSDYYRNKFGHIFCLTMERAEKLMNNRGGFRVVFRIGKGVGEGGDFVICLWYNTLITTDKGQLKIGDIVENELDVKVLSFNHKTEKYEYKPIKKYEKSKGRKSVEIKFSNGQKIKCTFDHPFYVEGKGYVEASDLVFGDKLITDDKELRNLSERSESKPIALCAEHERDILLTRLPRQRAKWQAQYAMARRKSGTFLRGLQNKVFGQTEYDETQISAKVLLKQMQRRIFQSADRIKDLLARLQLLWQKSSQGENASKGAKFLQSWLRGFRSSWRFIGREQRTIYSRQAVGIISERVFDGCAENQKERWSLLPFMRNGRNGKQESNGRSSHRLSEREQSADKSNQSLSVSSRSDARLNEITQDLSGVFVESVREIPEPKFVYNIEIPENHNYFANGVLAHNCDDPNDVEETESEQQLEKTNKGWGEISSQNVTDRTTAVRGINQQRTAPNDVTGYILENEKLKNRYSVLCLPNRFEDDHPDTNTPERPLYLGKVSDYDKARNPNLFIGEDKLWIDPRCKGAEYFGGKWYQEWYKNNFASRGLKSKGEPQLLWEDYIGDEETADAEAHLGGYGTSAQMQQRPIRRGGNFFNTENFKTIHYTNLALNGLKFCRYWDKAGSEGKGDWTVGLLLARTIKRPYRFWVVDVIRKQLGYYERMELIKSTAKQDSLDYIDKFFENEYSVVIEREPASSGKDVATIEKDELVGYDTHIDTVRKNKAIRAKPVRTFSESGRIQIVQGLWNEAFLKELQKFDANKPNQKNDQVDGLSGAFRFLAFGVSNRGSSESGSY